MSLQGPQLGTLFFFILDTNILNQPVDIVYKLAEAFSRITSSFSLDTCSFFLS